MATGTVIIVPGFLAAEILLPSWLAPLGALWCSPSRLALGGFDYLRLNVPGETADAPGDGTTLPGGLLPGLYTSLIYFLSARGWTVKYALSDWRRGLDFDAALLVALIRAESRTQPVRLVAHSRGGLVVRRALVTLADAGQASLVARVVSLGTPHTGSLGAAQLMGCYNPGKATIATMMSFVWSFQSQSQAKSLISRAARSWPGAYQLLPASGAPWLTGITAAQLYLPATWAGSIFDPVPDYLAAASANWAGLPLNATNTPWVDVVGTGVWTARGVRDGADVRESDSMTGDAQGDGAVTVESAHPTTRPVVYTPCAHDLLPTDNRIYDALQAHLVGQGAPLTNVTGQVFRV